MTFAQIEQEAMLKATAELSPLEYQLWTFIKMEEFLGEGVCRLNILQIKEKYRFKSYDYLSTAHKHLRLKKWILEHPQGVVCQTDFSQTIPLPETDEPKKLRNSKSKNKQKPTENFQATENFQVADLENQSPELRNSKLPTEKFQVNDLEILSSARAFKGTLNTQEFGKKKEEEKEPASSSANQNNFPAGEDSDESRRENLPNSPNGQTPKTEEPRGGEGKHNQPKNQAGAKFVDETRPDLADEQFLEHLAKVSENQGIDVQGLYIEMQRWCKKNRHTPSRGRFLNWLVVERKSKPMSLEITEEKINGNGNADRSGAQPNDAGSRNARRVSNTNAAISELVRRGTARRALSGGNDAPGAKNK